MRAPGLLVFALCLGTACGEPPVDTDIDAGPVCEPGSRGNCECAGGQTGERICADDGSRWGTCECVSGEPCAAEAECPAEEHCHPTLRICVPNCKLLEGACDDAPGTTCSEEDIVEPINGLSFNGICVCDPENDACPSSQHCNPWDLTCDAPCAGDSDCEDYETQRVCRELDGVQFCLQTVGDCRGDPSTCLGSTPVCDPQTGECIAECTAGSCGVGRYCDLACGYLGNGFCDDMPISCDNYVCAGYDLLCGRDTSDECLNVCTDPDRATNDCLAPGSRDPGGPLLFVDDPSLDIEVVAPADDPGGCSSSGNHPMLVVFTVVEGNASVAGEAQDSYWLDGAAWSNNGYFSSYYEGFLIYYMCFTASGPQLRAFYLEDNAGNGSNRVCVEFDVP